MHVDTFFHVKIISTIISRFCLFVCLELIQQLEKKHIEGTVLKYTTEHAGVNTLLSAVMLKNLCCIVSSWKDSTSGKTEDASQIKFPRLPEECKHTTVTMKWVQLSSLSFTPPFTSQNLQLLLRCSCLRSHFNTCLSDPTKWYNMSFSDPCSLEHNVSSLITKFIGNPDTT